MKMRGCGLRLLKVTLLIGTIFTAVLGTYRAIRWYEERPITGRLTYSSKLLSPLILNSGSFSVAWNPEHGGSLSITCQKVPGKIVWSTVPGNAFAAAASGEAQVRERRGMFSFRDRLKRIYNTQHIDSMESTENQVVIRGSLSARNGYGIMPFTFTLEERTPKHLGFELATDAPDINRLFLTYDAAADEGIYGFGAQFTHFDLKGKRVPIVVSEQGIGRGKQPLTFIVDLIAGAGGNWHTSYAPVPHYLTSAMRSLFLETHAYSVFDMRGGDRIQITLHEVPLRGSILAGETPGDLIGAYTAATGRMRPLPDWILEGAIIGMQGGTEKVRRVWRQLASHDTPLSAFWLQDWVGQRKTVVGKQLWWNWELDRVQYPQWEELLEDLSAQNIRVMTYINPFIIDPTVKPAFERNLFQEALSEGYLIREPDGGPYLVKNTDFSAAMVDLTLPEAYEWMKSVIRDQVVGAGASGWMADFGEALPYDARLSSGESAATFHNRYPEVWARLNREVIEETGRGDDFAFFMRSGYRESPRYSTLFWLGDQMTTWDEYDGIKSAVTGLLSSGLSGYAFNHSDIGGYTAVVTPLFTLARDRELLMRWMELNAFSVVFRTHEGIAPDANHQIYSDDATLAHFSRCAKLYAAWADYRKQLVQEAAERGLPVMRHPFIHYPRDERIRRIRYEQFMVGDQFMVAPVLDPGVLQVSCYLPEGRWIHLWTDTEYDIPSPGKEVVVAAPLGYPALFYKQESSAAYHFVNTLRAFQLLN